MQISYRTSSTVYRKIREEIDLYMISKYLTKNDRFNCNIYITNIMERELS